MGRQMTLELSQREQALAAGPHGVLLVDATQADFPIVYVNRGFEKITGYNAQEALGKNPRFLRGTTGTRRASRSSAKPSASSGGPGAPAQLQERRDTVLE